MENNNGAYYTTKELVEQIKEQMDRVENKLDGRLDDHEYRMRDIEKRWYAFPVSIGSIVLAIAAAVASFWQ